MSGFLLRSRRRIIGGQVVSLHHGSNVLHRQGLAFTVVVKAIPGVAGNGKIVDHDDEVLPVHGDELDLLSKREIGVPMGVEIEERGALPEIVLSRQIGEKAPRVGVSERYAGKVYEASFRE